MRSRRSTWLTLAGLSLRETGCKAAVNAGNTCVQEWPEQGQKEPGGSRSKKEGPARKTEYGGEAAVRASGGP